MPKITPRTVRILFLLLLCINVFYVLSGVLNFPLQSMDALGIWLLKAKFFTVSSHIQQELFQNSQLAYAHPQYPILLPLMFSGVYALIGGVHERVILLMYPVLYASVLFVCYRTMRKKFNTNVSLAFTYIYSMFSPLLGQAGRGHAGEADIFLVLIYWVVIFFILQIQFVKNLTNKSLALFIICVMVASSIKSEGIFLLSLFFLLPIPLRKKLFFSLVSAIPFLLWQYIVYTQHFTLDLFYHVPGAFEVYARFSAILLYTFQEMARYQNWYILWPVALLSFVLLKVKQKNWQTTALSRLCLVLILGFIANYVFSYLDIKAYLSSSLDRVFLQISPFVYVLMSMQLKPVIKTVTSFRRKSSLSS